MSQKNRNLLKSERERKEINFLPFKLCEILAREAKSDLRLASLAD